MDLQPMETDPVGLDQNDWGPASFGATASGCDGLRPSRLGANGFGHNCFVCNAIGHDGLGPNVFAADGDGPSWFRLKRIGAQRLLEPLHLDAMD